VAKGFASFEFSVSPISIGTWVLRKIVIVVNRKNGIKSLVEKYGWNLDLSMLGQTPIEEDEFCLCKSIMCKIAAPVNRNGIKKWRAKNRVSVGWSTENPPHSHVTITGPKYGMAEKMFVMTVAPQNDICPHGKTYPRKAVAISRIKIVIPLAHTCVLVLGELLNIPRNMCM